MKKQLAVYLDQLAGEVEKVNLEDYPDIWDQTAVITNSTNDSANTAILLRAASNLARPVSVRFLPKEEMPKDVGGQTGKDGIIMDASLPPGATVGTLAHEIAHWILHTHADKFIRMIYKLTGAAEIEAEATAWIVAKALGSNRESAPVAIANGPVAAKGTADALRQGGPFHDRVLGAAETILKAAHVDISNVAA